MTAFIKRADGEDNGERDAFLEALNGFIDVNALQVSDGPFAVRWHDVLDLTVLVFNGFRFGLLEVQSVKPDLDEIGSCQVSPGRFISHLLHGRAFQRDAHFWVSHERSICALFLTLTHPLAISSAPKPSVFGRFQPLSGRYQLAFD